MPGPGDQQRIDLALQVELLIRVDASRRTNRRHARGEKEPRIADAHEAHPAVVHVVVQPDDARDHRLAACVDDRRTRRSLHRRRRADLGDRLAANDDRLIVLRGAPVPSISLPCVMAIVGASTPRTA